MMISILKYAKKHGVSSQTVYNNIGWGLLKTALKVNGVWMIDENEPYPEHKRKKKIDNQCLSSNGKYKYERYVYGRIVYFGTFTSPEDTQQVKAQVDEIIAKYGSTSKALDLCLEIKAERVNNVWEKEILVLIAPEEIKEIRKGLNMTRVQFAKLMGLRKNTIANWEKGLMHPYKQTQHKLVELKQNIAMDPTGTAKKAHDMLSNGKVLCEKEKRKKKVLITPKEIQAIQDMMGMDFINFAIYLGVSRYTLYLWRNGDVHPRGENLSKLLELKKELDSLPPVEKQEPPPEENKQKSKKAEDPLTREKLMELKEAIEQETLTPDKIKTLRKSANMSRKQFAEHFGVTIYAVIKWQSGKAYPRKRYKEKFLELIKKLEEQ